MKLQWNSMSDFAKNILRKLGAVPQSEYDRAVRYNNMLDSELRILAKNAAKEFPFMIEPTVVVSHDRYYQGRRITLETKRLQFMIPDYALHNARSTAVYKKHRITQLSMDWAGQTEKVLDEMIKEL